MSTDQSERIRAALLRAKASRQPNQPPTLEKIDEPKSAKTLEGRSGADLEPPHSVSNKVETAEVKISEVEPAEAETPEVEAAEAEPEEVEKVEVEAALPLVAASDRTRVMVSREVERAGDNHHAPLPASRIDSSEPSGRGRAFRFIALAATVIAVAGLSLLFFMNYRRSDSKPATIAGTAPLQLQVESQGNGIIGIRWNPQSAAVTGAREGRLVILERDQQPRSVALPADQLKIGHMFYQSPAESTEFRLEIVSASGAVEKESVLALASGKAAEPPAGPPIAPTTSEATHENAKSEEVSTKENKADRPLTAQPPDQRPPSRTITRSFTPPPTPNPGNTAEPHALTLDAPPSVPNLPVAPPAGLPDAAARIASPSVAPPPTATAAPLKSGGDLQAPKLVKRVTPVYPPAAQASGIQGKVRFTARIDKEGMVRDLQVLSGPPVLVPSATEAVKKWIYRPMLLNGEPTEVVTQIEVNFTLHQ